MRESGLHVRSRKRWRLVSSSRHALPIAPSHLDRQFASDRGLRHDPRADDPGWLYLAVVLNLYSRADAPPHAAGLGVRRVGDDRRMPTAERRGAAALGSWSAYAYLALLGDIESRPAIHVQGLLGNAAIEGFFRPLKTERVFLTLYTSHHWAKTDLFDYVRFYNHRRPHSTLGYLSPMEFERRNASSSS